METVESLSKDIIEMNKKLKETEDPVQKEILQTEIADKRKKKREVQKSKITIPLELPKETEDRNVVLNTIPAETKPTNPALANHKDKDDDNEIGKPAKVLGVFIKTMLNAADKSIPYCEGVGDNMNMNDLLNACHLTIEDWKNSGIPYEKVLKPWVLLGGIVLTAVGGTMLANYEKKTGRSVIDSLLGSQQQSQASNSTDSGTQQKK